MNEHILIEAVSPSVDHGRYPAKRVAGQPCGVEADILRDGHDVLRAVVRWRGPGGRAWHEAPMEHWDNDRWRGEFPLAQPGRYEFTLEAWTDVYATWLADLRKRVAVREPIRGEVSEGITLLESFVDGAQGVEARTLREAIVALREASSAPRMWPAHAGDGADGNPPGVTDAGAAALAIAEDAALLEAVRAAAPRFGATVYEPFLALVVDRPRALYGTWYELFPRSQGTLPGRHGTFADAARRLPALREMGFDVVYLPPIHPIGTTHRKGRNNALTCQPGDPGSPWAIGSEQGGHDAVEPQLGTLVDFDRFVATAAGLGMEVALDFAIQASPDHPWVRSHPQWFFHRPDGSIKYAENPPKKYQDVYPLNFDTEDRQALWDEMLRVVRFWIGHGVKIFRVDNPHTKPLPFWQWLIAELQRAHPEAIFLAEAFTRPKMMRALAKIGFTQSYTYFTWRNHKAELIEYLTELTQTPMAEYYRPNFFVNTPDILHEVLQTGGRPAFKMRLVLAATLSPSYGIYSGFELCEHEAVPGTEEYLHSEKYEIKVRDWRAPGNIVDFVARVNAIRHENPALHALTHVHFLPTDSEHLLAYAKRDAHGANVLLVVVNLDPHVAHEGIVQVPPEAIGAAVPGVQPTEGYAVHDLLTGARYNWGAFNYVRLEPQVEPAHIFRVEARSP